MFNSIVSTQYKYIIWYEMCNCNIKEFWTIVGKKDTKNEFLKSQMNNTALRKNIIIMDNY